jgi:antitoxin component of MazEF toxin-antitoxin module
MPVVQKIIKRGNAYGITIPRRYLEELRLAPGQHVQLGVHGTQLLVEAIDLARPRPIVASKRRRGFIRG